MLRNAPRSCVRVIRYRGIHTAHRASPSSSSTSITVSFAAAVAAGYLWYTTPTIHNDSVQPASTDIPASLNLQDSSKHLSSLVWGSNKTHLIAPESASGSIRTPETASWLDGVALRDLQLQPTHAACVDARGDVYQWGDGFFVNGEAQKEKTPRLTLAGKNITRVQLCASRAFALSASGKIYALTTNAATQQPGSAPSWFASWISSPPPPSQFVEITSNSPLSWGEKFVSISGGDDHLLALSSSGRTFALPVTKKANSSGQLGIRKFTIPDRSAEDSAKAPRLDVELTPKTIADPYAKQSPYVRLRSIPSSVSENLAGIDDSGINFCDRLFEIPYLKGVNIAQITAAGRSSFARTSQGRVLGWGANENGQIGLGNSVSLDTITVPTEVILWTSPRHQTKCCNISAGGDLTAFTVERVTDDFTSDATTKSVDLVTCGNGQWGGLGNNLYTNAQGVPLRIKSLSSLKEFDEKTQRMASIAPHAVSVSSTGHVLLTLDTLQRSGYGGAGRDLLVWGRNHDSELGNGKTSSKSSPARLEVNEGQRFILGVRKSAEVRDMKGSVWKRRAAVEQVALAAPSCSVVYWKVL